jgi:sortase A
VRLAKVLSAMGRTCITGGVLILLFVVYQLWGTGIREAQAQDRLEDEFNQKMSQFSSDNATIGTTSPTSDTATTATLPVDPAEPLAAPPEGEVLGKIEIPNISLSAFVIEGVADGDLHSGPGHYPGTPLPGQAGNAAIAGHRTTYGAPFASLDDLKPDNEIKVTTLQGTFKYKVIGCDQLPMGEGVTCDDPASGHVIVSPTAVHVLDQVPNRNLLTLTACHPKYSAAKRIIVFAELQGEALAATPRAANAPPPQLEEVSGKQAPKLPVVLFGLLCAAIWIAAWAFGKYVWRKWPSYAIGLPFFLVALFYFFENFSRLLPSNF